MPILITCTIILRLYIRNKEKLKQTKTRALSKHARLNTVYNGNNLLSFFSRANKKKKERKMKDLSLSGAIRAPTEGLWYLSSKHSYTTLCNVTPLISNKAPSKT